VLDRDERPGGPRTRSRGFTLIEVLIALAVVAIALLALLGVASENVRVAGELRARTLADWVAWNRIEEARAATAPPVLGWTSGTTTMGPERWRWRMHARKSVLPGLYKIRVEAAPVDRPHDVLATLIALVAPPSPAELQAENAPQGALPTPPVPGQLPAGLPTPTPGPSFGMPGGGMPDPTLPP
jgi:general secretion pathway protein I